MFLLLLRYLLLLVAFGGKLCLKIENREVTFKKLNLIIITITLSDHLLYLFDSIVFILIDLTISKERIKLFICVRIHGIEKRSYSFTHSHLKERKHTQRLYS